MLLQDCFLKISVRFFNVKERFRYMFLLEDLK